MGGSRGSARVTDSVLEADRLRREFEQWLGRRRDCDPLRQYATQLDVLESEIGGAISATRTKLDDVDIGGDLACVYDVCRHYDRELAFIRRVWWYYRDKFDQRDDPVLAPVLAAADEIVWSSYSPVFAAAHVSITSAPLAYIEPRYSPAATPRVTPPIGLDPARDGLLIKTLDDLPVPVIALPPMCVTSPWWLIHLVHEVGHHVQYDLVPGESVEAFANAVEAAVVARDPGRPNGAKRWAAWSREIFADVFSVLSAGDATRWSIGELEATRPASMIATTNGSTYPPPAIRSAMMRLDAAHDAGTIGVQQESVDTGAASDDDVNTFELLMTDVAPVVDATLRTPLGGHGNLPTLCGFTPAYFSEDGEVDTWRKAFSADREPEPETLARSARLGIAGAVCTWERIARLPDPAKQQHHRERLADRVLTTIARCRPEGTRAPESRARVADRPSGLADRLIRATYEELD